jgi:hypothetical protein
MEQMEDRISGEEVLTLMCESFVGHQARHRHSERSKPMDQEDDSPQGEKRPIPQAVQRRHGPRHEDPVFAGVQQLSYLFDAVDRPPFEFTAR